MSGYHHIKRWVSWVVLALGLGQTGLQATELTVQLKGPDHVLLVRHAYAPGVGDPPGYSLQRCESQRLLSEEGRRQAVRMGQWLRAQGLDKAQVHSSIWCRCQETASLMNLGGVKIEPSLASFFEESGQAVLRNKSLQEFIARALKTKGDKPLILVTHHVNIREFMGRDIGSGDMVLARVDLHGRVLDYQVILSP